MVDVIIPVYKPDEKFYKLMKRLQKQTVKPNRIFIIQTIDEQNNKDIGLQYQEQKNVTVVKIEKKEFDHGGTRNFGASLSKAEFILFMTQDAVPCNKHLIEELLKPLQQPDIAVAYARQIADKKAGILEQYTRKFNYPKQSHIKTEKDLEKIGIKTYFCSNVCAMYQRELYEQLGGFVTKTIFNEDMIMASKVIKAGYAIAYAADAKVNHWHKYTYRQQFSRNFDLAVSQVQYKEIFGAIKSETEGVKYVLDTSKYLLEHHIYLLPDFICQSIFKFLGYQLGKHYEKLPKSWVEKCSMNKTYWKNESIGDE